MTEDDWERGRGRGRRGEGDGEGGERWASPGNSCGAGKGGGDEGSRGAMAVKRGYVEQGVREVGEGWGGYMERGGGKGVLFNQGVAKRARGRGAFGARVGVRAREEA